MVRNLLRCWGALAAIALVGLAHEAYAEKVGVAAAVNPDAFSSLAGKPQSQLNIGKSIFYHERINTTGSGLVQVLLVDGSTFTVGPGSDLVIDRFVYDPKKGTGQITASFSKGVMRFVGGKISKNEGGVTVDTPAGVLAIRGGIWMGKIDSPKDYALIFVFGRYLKLNGDAAYEFPWGFFAENGNKEKRPATPDEIRLMVAALSNSSYAGGNQDNVKPNNFQLVNTENMSELINDATTQRILAAAPATQEPQVSCQELGNCEAPPPPLCDVPGTCGAPGGYAVGVFGQPVKGILQDVLFDPESNSVSFGVSGGETIEVRFNTDGIPIDGRVIRGDIDFGTVQFQGGTSLSQEQDLICAECDFLDWGRWTIHINYKDPSQNPTVNLHANGWWVSGAPTNVETLAALNGSATYNGTAHGTVLNGSRSYDATGGLTMNWSFADRTGDLTISNFDQRSYSTGLNGLSSLEINKFGGSLGQIGGPDIGLNSGSVTGSFINNGSTPAGGVAGKFNIGGDNYQATGVFGGSGTPTTPH